MTDERIIHANGVDLCVRTFGAASHPALLLLSGGNSSMDFWDDAFCERLAAGLRYVIRYDQRDTGRSTRWSDDAPAYTVPDLVQDAAALLEALGVRQAHLAGLSLGATVALRLALKHPERVASLVLISSSPGGAGLPPMTPALKRWFAKAEAGAPGGSDRAALASRMIEELRVFGGRRDFDEAAARRIVERVLDRAGNVEAGQDRHLQMDGGEPLRPQLKRIAAPTLVIHGTDDPLYALPHGEALAAEIPGARLLLLAHVGHEAPPPSTWDRVIPAVLQHTSGGWGAQADRLAARALADGQPTRWFDELYASAVAGTVTMPWSQTSPRAPFAQWTARRCAPRPGSRALVVGCGLGGDAQHTASLGFETTAFDISPTAVRVAQERFPHSPVRYVVANLLEPPAEWLRAFDLVVEIYTCQALPLALRAAATAAVGRFVRPGGTLVAIAAARDDDAEPLARPPWPLSRAEVDGFAADGLQPVLIERIVVDHDDPSRQDWRAEFVRPA